VLLAHQPVQVAQAAAAGVDLQLSGHTHGGQLWPFDYVVGLEQPVVEGLSRYGDTQIYVTRGAGYWGPPMRVGARPGDRRGAPVTSHMARGEGLGRPRPKSSREGIHANCQHVPGVRRSGQEAGALRFSCRCCA
jgi:hypothetical protein